MRVIATAGHVDHGKSSLVRALTGVDPDRFAEEKRRGLTIDLGFAHTALASGNEVSFVDVPGHTRFLSNMLAGIGGVDACMFVVAATEGWMPQSEEHLRIIDLLGIRHGFVVLTKRDLVDDELAELAMLDIADHVAGTFLEGAPIAPVATTNGTGLEDVLQALDQLVRETPGAADRKRARLWIDRAFAAKGSGTVVTGTLTGGSLQRDDDIIVEPGAQRARIRGIQTLGRAVDQIGPGNRVALNLNGVGHDELRRGDVVVMPERWFRTATADASLSVLPALDHPVSRRGAYVAYVGSRELPVRLRVLGEEAIAPGTQRPVRLFLPVELPLLPGDRFVLRESGRDETVGGGEILDIDPQLQARHATPDRSIERVIGERGWVEVDTLERLTGETVAPAVGNWVASPELVETTTEALLAAVTDAGALGLETATLTDYQRLLLEAHPDVTIDAGRARPAAATDPFADHPLARQILAGGFTPTTPADADRAVIKELVARGTLVLREQVLFHDDIIGEAAQIAKTLLSTAVDGFTVAEFRDATGTSRKYALPLVAELDARGITRRRGDVRIAGPRLPT